MCEYSLRWGRHEKEGVEVFRYKIKIPVFKEKEKINLFYQKIMENTESFCVSELFGLSEIEYEKSAPSLRKFRYPTLIYELYCEALETDEGKNEVKLKAALARKGEKTAICEYTDIHLWSMEDELLIPLQKKKKYGNSVDKSKNK